VNLLEEESVDGHTIKRHVGRSDASLMGEASIPNKVNLFTATYKATGSFLSLSSANDFVNQVLQRNTTLVDAVASGALDQQWLEARFGYPTGKEALVNDESLSMTKALSREFGRHITWAWTSFMILAALAATEF